jgi:hypothetical protein
MKAIVKRELEGQDYFVSEEPPFPPEAKVEWRSYRPDLLGYRIGGGAEELVVVECETHPSKRRFEAKNFSSLRFQPFLFQRGSIRRILAVPQGKLPGVDLRLRREWEIWVLGRSRPIHFIGTLGGNEEPLPSSKGVLAPV